DDHDATLATDRRPDPATPKARRGGGPSGRAADQRTRTGALRSTTPLLRMMTRYLPLRGAALTLATPLLLTAALRFTALPLVLPRGLNVTLTFAPRFSPFVRSVRRLPFLTALAGLATVGLRTTTVREPTTWPEYVTVTV